MSSSSPRSPRPVRFDPTQNSLVFINCCFAISLGGPILILSQMQDKASANWSELLPSVPLAVWLTFSVWRQYTIYYIPLQYYRARPETDAEELVTLSLTLTLFALSLAFAVNPDYTPTCLATILVLTIVKLNQMSESLGLAPCPDEIEFAREELNVYTIKLKVYLALLALLWLVMNIGYVDLLRNATARAVTWGLSPILLQLSVGHFMTRLYKRKHTPSPEKYLQCLDAGWPPRNIQ